VPTPHIRPTTAPTPTRVVAIARPRRVSHHARTIVFTVVGRLIRLPVLRPVLPPQPAAPTHGRSREPTDAHRREYGASRSCSWPFSVRAIEEDMVAPVMLRLS
jgi:hypothetical protein